MPGRRPIEKRKSLIIPSILAVILLIYVHFTFQQLELFAITEGEEVSPGLVVALSNKHKIFQATAQQLQQQQQHSLEPSDEIQTNDVNKKAIQWLQSNDNSKVINAPPQFKPPPGYWEHPHQEFGTNNTVLNPQHLSLLRKQYLKQRHNQLHRPILPEKVITIVGPESSGSTFLATSLAAAVGASLGITKKVNQRARSGKYEIQHLSLPWGWCCGDDIDVNIVDAMVPAECFRYELAPALDPVVAQQIWMAEQQPARTLEVARDGPQTESEAQSLQQCRDEVSIFEQSNLSCGAKCGAGVYNGYALYPRRFSVNITSHIEWYLQRGVDVTVILSTRDRSISKRGKEKLHCKIKDVGQREDEVALELMNEGLEKYGPFGSIGRNRVIVSSYEALMSMKNEYLFGLYKQLRINSTYVPSFVDGNEKYVTDANVANTDNNAVAPLSSSKYDISAYQPKPSGRNYGNPKVSFLPKKLITVVGLEGSGGAFLATTLGEVVSTDDEYRLQHISLPYGWSCESSASEINANVVDALVPEECFRYEHILKDHDPLSTRKCKDEVHISDESSKWRCGAKCGEGQLSGLALYPDRFYVNITSHIQWYLRRGVDVKVILVLRDKTISNKEKLRNHHCYLPPEVVDIEDDTAMEIMREAYEKYGEEGRVMVVSYEGLMQFKQSYLYGIYKSLGIESMYVPDFVDDNRLYVSPDRQHQMHGPALHRKGHGDAKRK